MSVKVMAAVWEHSPHRGGTLLVHLAIADHASDEGIAWPSVDSLGKKARMSSRNVQLALAKLQETGDLVIDRGQGAHGCNLYRLSVSPGGEKFSGVESFRGEKNNRGGEKNDTGGVKPASPEPSVKPSKEPSTLLEGATSKKTRRTTVVDEAFIDALVTDWQPTFGSEASVRDRIAAALGHVQATKYTDLRAYVRNWLRKDAERMPTRRAGATSPNGHVTASAAVRAASPFADMEELET